MKTFLALTKLGILLLWRQTKLAAGRLFWFWIAYSVGMAAFNTEFAASLLAAVVAMVTLQAAITDNEIEESVKSVTKASSNETGEL